MSVLVNRTEANFCHSAVTEVNNERYSASNSPQVFMAYIRTISLYSHILMLSLFSLLSVFSFPLHSCVSYQYFPSTPPWRDWSVTAILRYFVTGQVYSSTGFPQDVRFGAECFRWEEDKWHSRMHTHISSLFMYELKTLTSVIFETSFCITDRSIQFQFSS